MTGTRQQQIVDILNEVAEAHHMVYKITEGDHPDWASWYADQMINRSYLPDVLASVPVPSELVYLLVLCDKEYTAMENPSESWQEYYGRRILEHFAPEN